MTDGEFEEQRRPTRRWSASRVRVGVAAFGALAMTLAALAPAAGARAWHPAEDLAAPGGQPAVAMDAAGDALIVWTTENSATGPGGSATVRGVLRDSGGALLDLGDLSAGERNVGPRAVMNHAGDAVVVWLNNDDPNASVVQAVVGSADGEFSEPFTLSAAGERASGAELAINEAGDALVVWSGDGIVQAAVLPADGSLSTGPVAPGFNPQAAIDAAGNTTVVWQTVNVVQAATRPAGGSFSTPVDVSVSGPVYLPDVAVDPAGNAVVAWRHYDAGTYVVQTAARPAGGVFSAPADMPGANFGIFQQVGIDQAGTATAAWLDADGLKTAVRPAGAAFSMPALVAGGGETLRLAVDPVGGAAIAWHRFVGSNAEVQASVRIAGGEFAAPVTLSAAGVFAFSASTAIDADGDAIAVWQTSSGVVQAAVYDASPLPQPPPVAGPPAPQPVAAAPCLDCDGDGRPAPGDCNDANPAVHPGAIDVPANALDENCDGRDAPYPRLGSAITYAVSVSKRRTTFTKLTVRPVRAGTRIRITCKGRGCPFKSKTLAVAKSARARDLLPLLKRRRLGAGAQLEIRLTKPGTVGVVRRLQIRSAARPLRTDRCLLPGASAPTVCPR